MTFDLWRRTRGNMKIWRQNLTATMRFKCLKTLLLLVLLGGDIGPEPVSLETHLPPAPALCDQANLLFAPVSLDCHRPYSAGISFLAVFCTIVAGLIVDGVSVYSRLQLPIPQVLRNIHRQCIR